MQIVPRKAALVGLGAAGVLALAVAVPTVALAEDPTPAPSTSSSSAPSRTEQHEERRAEHNRQLAEGLAAELGVDVEKVTAALEKVQGDLRTGAEQERQAKLKERLDAAVEEGELTREQADAIIAGAEAGVLGGKGGGFGPGPGRGGR
ncbi:hypothetical protein [Polymorphospora sp. NPDC050346]|uniref:hypothetical protein n=1 Tax=Polymorphospora sp. NPDC050346 TaxID=3155780 RepID=UPI0033D0EE1F